MVFIPSLIVVGLACITAATPILPPIKSFRPAGTLKKRAGGSCTDANFAAVAEVGSAAVGTPFCESDYGTSYEPISGLTVWNFRNYVSGIQATYADGSVSALYGVQSNTSAKGISVNYALGERFSAVTLYANANDPYLRRIAITTSTGATLNAGEPVRDGVPSVAQSVGAGILFGIQGTYSTAINSFGMIFLGSPIKEVDITDLAFPNGPAGTDGLHDESLAQGHFYNAQTTGNSTWTFADSRAIATSHTFAQASATMFGINEAIAISGGIPTIITIGSTTTFMWSNTYTTTNTVQNTETVTVTWSEMGSLMPQTGVDTAAIVATGSGTFPYTSLVTIVLENGQQYQFNETGALTINDVSGAIVTVSDDDNPGPTSAS